MTQHDHFYTGKKEEEMDTGDTKDHVFEGLLELGFNVPKEQIVVVSGMLEDTTPFFLPSLST